MDSRVSFVKGIMNKSYDQRLLPEGEYIDAMNIRLGSTEDNSIGVVENTKGNVNIASLQYEGNPLSENALCIGVYADGTNETLYWFVTDSGNGTLPKVDMIVSFNTETQVLIYHVISTTVLNFNSQYLITGVNLIDKYLFWTDNYNPPRKINTARTYFPPVMGVDSIIVEDVNVIVAPPLEAPKIELISLAGGENFINDVFISFAYRYKYRDNEYSALSQFSDVAFEPGTFGLNYSTYDNSAMENIFNAVKVTFNTGDLNVIGIDLCFKYSDTNIVNIVEKYIKNEQGWGNNHTTDVVFDNKKIYTTLIDSELLRLYDNVPHKAKAQTTMGNRIMYGNYVDGYNIQNADGTPIKINYNIDLISDDVQYKTLDTTTPNGTYTISGSSISVNYSKYTIDFGANPLLTMGSSLLIDFNIQHNSFGGDSSYADSTAPLNQFTHTLLFTLPRDYTSVADLASSIEFANVISNPKPMINCVDGYSVSDYFNCSILEKSGWKKITSGVDNIGQGFVIYPTTNNIITIQIPAVQYQNIANPALIAYEYFENSSSLVSFTKTGSKRSLHSNRDYEIGIVYMDEYNRSTTALVCTTNTIFIPESKSIFRNHLRASISNNPPYWATRYKWVIKPSKTDYNTIYTTNYYQDTINDCVWFYLEGDNRSKAKENDFLIVKADSNGALNTLVKTKVLQFKYLLSNDLSSSGISTIPEGSYMKLKPSGFSVLFGGNSNINRQSVHLYGIQNLAFCNLTRPTSVVGVNEPIPIKAGSKVRIYLRCERGGGPARYYTYDQTLVSSNDYNNLHEYVIGEQIDLTNGLNENDFQGTQFNTAVLPFTQNNYENLLSLPNYKNQVQFFNDSTGGFFLCMGAAADDANGHTSWVDIEVNIEEPNKLVVFETEPNDGDGEKFYENNQNFEIINGLHQGSIFDGITHNQTSSTPAICDLNFFDCFTFGNGVESYKIDDSLTGAPLYLGSRVNAVSQQEYKETNRYASITYSGVYNAESNINKLNEFNLGLANYKDLQKSFGPIQTLFARATDILTLQEDKISYVLQGKNLLSDAAAGGAITSIPEVLGTQIARIENFGISHNPESFASWGNEMVWTDAKRSSVLKLTGTSYATDQLQVISDINMKVWFRDLFKDSFGTQKLMAYDPYMDEFVLSSNERPVIIGDTEQNCGLVFSQTDSSKVVEFNVELGAVIGDTLFNYDFTQGSAILVVEYDGDVVLRTTMRGADGISFNKNSIFPTKAKVTITPTNATYTFTSNCPTNFEVTIKRIVLNNHSDVNMTIHNSYDWTYGAYVAPSLVDNIVLDASGISLFASQTGISSSGVFPISDSDIRMYSSKLAGDTYIFNNGHFRYLITDTDYSQADINTIINTSTIVTPVLNPSTGVYNVDFTYSNPLSYPFIYLIWDYRNSTEIDLCYGTNVIDACCDC